MTTRGVKTNGSMLFKNARERAEFGATVSFENADEKTLTLAYTGIGPRMAVDRACGVAIDLDPSFRVVAISTPSSIYLDLDGRKTRGGRAQFQEGQILSQAGWGYMLHERLGGRRYERWSV